MSDDPRGDGTSPHAATMIATPDGTLELPASDRVQPGELGPGATIGHFVIDARIGEGGMGVVFAGHDADLGRRVALKLVRTDIDHPAYHARLLREAQVMARLEHPNVVKVYEVGSDRGRLFVAMELVDGTTLSAWLRAAPRSSHDVVAMFQQIGAGLAAVHRAGLVHRDFKPDNVLVDRTGRARVADFGLARIDRSAPFGGASPAVGQLAAGSPALTSLTQTGARMGTPGYIAPEQQLGSSVDARADQYSYCVALREALAGGKAKGSQHIPQPLRAIVARGLSYDASERFASMDELLVALGRGDRRRAWWIGAAVAVALAGGGAAIALGSAGSAAPIAVVATRDAPANDSAASIGNPATIDARTPDDATALDAAVRAMTAHRLVDGTAPPRAVDAGSRDAHSEVDAAEPPTRHPIPEAHVAAVRTALAALGYRGLSFEGDGTNDAKDLRDKLAALTANQTFERGRLLWALGVVQRKQGACDDAIATLLDSRKALAAHNHEHLQDTTVWAWFTLDYLDAALCDFALDRVDATRTDLEHALQTSFAVTPVVHGEILLAMGILEWETLDPVRGKATIMHAGQLGDARLRATLETWAAAVGMTIP